MYITYKYTCVLTHTLDTPYGVATMSRILKIIGLFCKKTLQKRRYSAKETYDFKEPTNRSHPKPYNPHTRKNTRHTPYV